MANFEDVEWHIRFRPKSWMKSKLKKHKGKIVTGKVVAVKDLYFIVEIDNGAFNTVRWEYFDWAELANDKEDIAAIKNIPDLFREKLNLN